MDPEARRLCICVECTDVFSTCAEFLQAAVGGRGDILILV